MSTTMATSQGGEPARQWTFLTNHRHPAEADHRIEGLLSLFTHREESREQG
ncbi:hypothetical protein [Actinoallomurus sp. NPDC050550]|uniref:hypothetical protein n=1 Tax=Actinoallomurus sp. NPDC050550 TaxID=3154937 RepID=UPI0033FDE045